MAGSGVNVKMGVSGVAQFKQSMNQAKQAVKTLDAQLALNEKQLKAGGDAEALMAEKSALLQAKLENQKSAIASAEQALENMAKNGVERSSKAYQDMYRQMVQMKGSLLDTESAMNGVTEAGDAAADSTSDLINQLQNINKGVSVENVANGIRRIDSVMTKAAKKAWELGKAIVNEVLGAGNWADDLATRASNYGISTDELQRMDKTAKLIDTTTESIINAQNKLKKGIGKQDKGVLGAFAEILGKGYDPRQKDWKDAFWDAGEAIMRFADAEEQEAYAQTLFGRSWHELVPLFEAGRKEYEKMNASWNVVPEDSIKALTDMDDQYQKLENELETVRRQFEAELAPAVEKGLKILTDLMAKFNEYLASPEGQAAMDKLGNTITGLVESLLNVDPDAVVNALADAIGKVTEALTWIDEHGEDVANGIKGIAIAFGLIKVTSLATNIAQITHGLSGFLGRGGGGGGGGAPTVAPTAPPAQPSTPVNPVVPAAPAAGAAAKAATAMNMTALANGAWGLAGGVGVAGYTLLGLVMMAANANAREQMDKWAKKGEESIQHFEEVGQQFQDSDYFNMWSQLSNYLTVGGDNTKRKQDIEAFAEHYMEWFNDQVQDPLLDHIVNEVMTDEEYDAFHEAMERVTNGAHFYNDEERDAFGESLQRMLEIVESEMQQSTKVEDAGKDISAAADRMERLPQMTANAVASALSGITINIDGPGLTTAVGGMMGGIMAAFNV